jgi:hypothetical protein
MPQNMADVSMKRKAAADARKLQRKGDDAARDQFAALGRFIQSFEDIVSTLRWHCHRIMLGDHLGIANPDSRAMLPWWNITSMIFHCETFTAKSVLDIWRSLLADKC